MLHDILDPTPRRRRQRPGGPRRWTAADKASYLARFAESPLSGAAFCRAVDVPRATFTLWQREARATAARRVPRTAPRSAGFARVEVVSAVEPRAVPPARDATGGAAITLVVRGGSGIEAELTGVDAGTAVQVVRLVLARFR